MTVIFSEGRATRIHNAREANIREVVTELTRSLEDASWINMSSDWRGMNGNDDRAQDRVKQLTRIRQYRRHNPLAKNAAGILQHYVVGQGISTRAENKKVVAKLVDEFWNDPTNQAAFTSHAAAKKFVDDIWTDGEVFLVLYPDTEQGTLTVSTIDPVFVDDPITDVNNRLIPRWYKVAKPVVKYDWKVGQWDVTDSNKFVYYRDWQNKDDKNAPPVAMQEKGLIYHVYAEKRGKHGESQLLAAMDWLKAHRDFMEDRATINRAAAQIAWKKKRTGGANDIASEVARIRSSLTQNVAQYETNPAPASGATIVENQGSSLEWVKTDTGGAAALSDERILRMMTGAGMGGIPNHYQGDEAAANLATATAMELPLLKTYEDWQQLLRDVYGKVLEFMLTVANEAGRVGDRDDSRKYAERVTTPQAVASMPEQQGSAQAAGAAMKQSAGPIDHDSAIREAFEQLDPSIQPATFAGVKLIMIPKQASAVNTSVANDSAGAVSWYIDVDFPPILQKDLQQIGTALKDLFGLLPEENIESQKLIVEMFLQALGVNDIDQQMERLFPADMVAVLVPKQPPLVQAPGPAAVPTPGAPGSAPATPKPAVAQTQESEVVASLAEHRVRRLLRIATDVDRAAEPDELAVAVGETARLRQAVGELAASRIGDQAAMARIAEAIAARPIHVDAATTISPGAVAVTVEPAPVTPARETVRETEFITNDDGRIVGKREVTKEAEGDS